MSLLLVKHDVSELSSPTIIENLVLSLSFFFFENYIENLVKKRQCKVNSQKH